LLRGKRIKTLFSFGFGQIEIAPDLDEVHGSWPREGESEKLSKLPIKLRERARKQCEKRQCGHGPNKTSNENGLKLHFPGGGDNS